MQFSLAHQCFSRLQQFVACVIVCAVFTDGLAAQEAIPSISLADRRELFVDSWLTDELTNIRLMLHKTD